METILYISLSLAMGCLISYMFFKLAFQKSHVSKAEFQDLQTEVEKLRIDNALRLTKEEV
jgi:hypothetical protein